ncbi:MAG: AAA family ATPase [Actinobacteria bacterium]|nr:AAA family ATPase [Actinomycetota bacterium]
MSTDPELEAEQRYIDRAYRLLDDARRSANRLKTMVEVGAGGTNQARFERDVIYSTVDDRLADLDVGDASLVFGRIDLAEERSTDPSRFYIGRLPVSDESHDAVVVDWRAPIAEPFYRATGPNPMGLERRRHFASRGRTLLDIDDETFGSATPNTSTVSGRRALVAALEAGRTGRLGDVVGTIQAEQDQVIRAPMPGVLVVQGGPGTGKTVVALHRAAYLLYTHRFPLEGQGVLVVGPNRLFLAYIEQVLPSLGEAGVHLAVPADLIDPVSVRGDDPDHVARIKGDPAMATFVRNAVRDRRRPLRRRLTVPFGLGHLELAVDASASIVAEAARRFRRHNPARRFVEDAVFAALAASSRTPISGEAVADRLRNDATVRAALEWMWPVLTPAELLHELFGSRALLRRAARGAFDRDAAEHLYRPWSGHVRDVVWTRQDVALLDEASVHLGVLPGRAGKLRADGTPEGEIRTWGHIVVDEAQDLSPMQLRMLERRSLGGSMTIVGDIAQATSAWGARDWFEVLDHLPDRRGARVTELTIGYRIPAPLMAPAAKILARIAPELSPPIAVRTEGTQPAFTSTADTDFGPTLAKVVRDEVAVVGRGNVAVIVPESLVEMADRALDDARIEHGAATTNGLEQQVTIVPVRFVKGLEVDAAVVAEPQAIIDTEPRGLHSLYVAFTRATKRLHVVYTGELPEVLADTAARSGGAASGG